jgi:hypothetical protein
MKSATAAVVVTVAIIKSVFFMRYLLDTRLKIHAQTAHSTGGANSWHSYSISLALGLSSRAKGTLIFQSLL